MDLRSEFNKYRALGFITGSVDDTHPPGNSIFTAEAILVLSQNGGLTPEDLVQYNNTIKQCELAPGLYGRPPGYEQDQESLDDFIGIGTASYLLGTDHAQKWLAWGRSHYYQPGWIKLPYQFDKGIYDHDTSWRVQGWMGRFPALIAHMKYAAGEWPPFWQRFWWACSVAFSGSSLNQDPWILSWLMVHTLENRCWMGSVASAIRLFRLKRCWPGGIKSVLAAYFGDAGHPLAKYAKD